MGGAGGSRAEESGVSLNAVETAEGASEVGSEGATSSTAVIDVFCTGASATGSGMLPARGSSSPEAVGFDVAAPSSGATAGAMSEVSVAVSVVPTLASTSG